MINQFKFKFTYNMYQALQAHMKIPTRDVPSKGKDSDDSKASTTYKIKSNYNNFISNNNLENSKNYD